jgi:excisionase family DNA binding protein
MATVEKPSAAHDIEILTLAEAATYLRIDEDTLKALVSEQGLPGRQIGNEWRFLREAIHEWLKGPTQKERALAFAGAFRDDPDLEEITAEIFRARGRAIRENE